MTEHALNPVVREDPPGITDLDLFESLLGCQSIEELHAATAGIAKRLGFEHFIYGVNVNVSLTRPYQFFLSGYPKEWWKHYTDSDYKKIDPIVRHAAEKVIPVIWDKRLAALLPRPNSWARPGSSGWRTARAFPCTAGAANSRR